MRTKSELKRDHAKLKEATESCATRYSDEVKAQEKAARNEQSAIMVGLHIGNWIAEKIKDERTNG